MAPRDSTPSRLRLGGVPSRDAGRRRRLLGPVEQDGILADASERGRAGPAARPVRERATSDASGADASERGRFA